MPRGPSSSKQLTSPSSQAVGRNVTAEKSACEIALEPNSQAVEPLRTFHEKRYSARS